MKETQIERGLCSICVFEQETTSKREVNFMNPFPHSYNVSVQAKSETTATLSAKGLTPLVSAPPAELLYSHVQGNGRNRMIQLDRNSPGRLGSVGSGRRRRALYPNALTCSADRTGRNR
jgi:hypothetical protein